MSACDLIQIEVHGEVDAALPLGIITYLCETGKAGRFVHNIACGASQWEKVCALEEALVDSHNEEDFFFFVGAIIQDSEVRGWLEFEDVILFPYGPERQKHGSDFGVYSRDLFDATVDYAVYAFSPCADDSAIHLNKIVRALTGKPIGPTGAVG